MKFPLLNISEQNWKDEDLLQYIQFDEFIYTDNQAVFEKYLKDKSFCDCNGEIFKVKSKIHPNEWWRKVFRFLPNVYNIKLTFESTGEFLSLNQLKILILERINGLSENDHKTRWIKHIKKAKIHEEIICGQIE